MRKLYIWLGAVAGGVFALSLSHAQAATSVYFQAPADTVFAGTPFSVAVDLDADSPVNAYSVALKYGGANLSLAGIDTSQSIISISDGDPLVTPSGTIAWRGGSPVAFSGKGGNIFTLNLVAGEPGTAHFSFADTRVYLANGKGTEEIPLKGALDIAILPSSSSSAVTPVATTSAAEAIPPSIQWLSFSSDPVNPSQKLVIFLIGNGGGGANKNELRYRSGFLWNDWREVKNPVPVPTAVWEADFRTTDAAGNTARATIYDRTAFIIFLLKDIAAAAFGAGITFLILRRKR